MIKFANSDSKIWNRDSFIISIIEQMIAGNTVVLDTNGEGPCATSLGLYQLLDELCLKFGYKKNKITLRTCNLVEQHPEYLVHKIPQTGYLNFAKKYTISDHRKQFDQIKHFGNFIGHGNLHRLSLASTLYKCYRNKSLQTYHCNPQDPYHREFIGLEDLMFHGASYEQVEAAIELISQSPITQDQINNYPIVNPTTLNITKLYKNFFVELVNLTYWSGNSFYLDEKIWRPIMMRTPFIVQGPQNFILRFRQLGFKTFSDYWDEGYNEDPVPCHTSAIVDIVHQLAKNSIKDLQHMYQDMQPVLEHNYQLFQRLTKQDLEKFAALYE